MPLRKVVGRGLSGPDLRAAIQEVEPSQAKFAARLGVSANVVSGWIKKGAPGYVTAYLKLHEEFRAYRARVKEHVAGLVE